MFISSTSNITELNDSKKSEFAQLREKAGIVDARRSIYIFHDEKNPFICKVIHVNISVTKGTHVLFDKTFMNRGNGCLSFVAVYTYNCKLNTCYKTLKEQFLHGILNIISVKRSDRETDFTNQYTRNEFVQLYSKMLPHYKLTCNIDSRSIIHPKYYTQEHEYYGTGDCNFEGIIDNVDSLRINGIDIVDDITEIYKQNASSFKNISDSISNMEAFDNNYNHSLDGAGDVIRELNYTLTYDSLVNGGVFIYDTNSRKTKIKDSSILCKQYIDKASAITELETFLLTLENIGNNIQQQDGNVVILYTPSLLGSKCRVIYRDHNNMVSDSGLKESISSKDSSYEVTETINEFVDNTDSVFVHDQVYEDIDYPENQKEKIVSYYT